MSSAYSRGANFERRILKIYGAWGYDVFRSAGSHGAADLLCASRGEVIAMQVQIDKYFPPAKIEALRELAQRQGWRGMLVWRDEKKKVNFKEIE